MKVMRHTPSLDMELRRVIANCQATYLAKQQELDSSRYKMLSEGLKVQLSELYRLMEPGLDKRASCDTAVWQQQRKFEQDDPRVAQEVMTSLKRSMFSSIFKAALQIQLTQVDDVHAALLAVLDTAEPKLRE